MECAQIYTEEEIYTKSGLSLLQSTYIAFLLNACVCVCTLKYIFLPFAFPILAFFSLGVCLLM